MFKRWYIYETNNYFISDHKAYHKLRGPYTKSEALEASVWRLNQIIRNEEQANVIVIHSVLKREMNLEGDD